MPKLSSTQCRFLAHLLKTNFLFVYEFVSEVSLCSVSMPRSCCFGNYSFEVCFQVRYCDTPALLFCLAFALAVLSISVFVCFSAYSPYEF